MTATPRPRVFVSSPGKGLKEHRDSAIRALRQAGYDAEAMEDWTADARTATAASLYHLRDCDLVVLLVARHLGHTPAEGGGRSITQLEFDYAADPEHPIDLRVFFLDDAVTDWPSADPDEAKAVEEWKATIRDCCVWSKFGREPSSLEKPLLAAVVRWRQERNERQHLDTYFRNVVESHRLLNILDVPDYLDEANVPLEQLYVEQAVSETELSPDQTVEWAKLPAARNEFAKYSRLVLLGDPGGGKTSIVQWIAWQFASDALGPPRRPWPLRLGNDRRRPFIPVPIILREMKLGHDLTWDRLMDTFLATKDTAPLRHVDLGPYLEEGRVLFLLDGLDEVGDLGARLALRRAVHDGLERHKKCRWLLTSRVVGYDEVPFHPEPLYLIPGSPWNLTHRLFLALFDDERIKEYCEKWYVARPGHELDPRKQAEQLVEAIHRNEGTLRLARIPFLLSLMAVVHRRRIDLPDGRALLYQSITDAFLSRRDKRKKLDTLPEEEAIACLSRVGIEMQRRLASQEKDDDGSALIVGEPDMRGWLRTALEDSSDKADRFLTRLHNRSGLLLPRGVGRFAFIHRSFQEFFAARFLYEQVTSKDWIREKYDALASEAHPNTTALGRFPLAPREVG